jgi:hydroxymethylpyrimidine pyrophosphatase-like HAD family hydrolase
LRERLGPFVDFTMPPGRGQEFVAKGVSKAEGVAAVLRRLGKGWGDVVAFGDNWNDLSVLRRARVGFVMGNAPAGLPREGLALAPTCDEDGVAVVLERLERAVSDPAAVAGWSGAGDHPQELVHRLGGAGGQQLR